MDKQAKDAIKDMATLLEEIGFEKYSFVEAMKKALIVRIIHADIIKEVESQ